MTRSNDEIRLADVYPSNNEKLQEFQSGATRTPSRLRYDLVPPAALRALAERYGIGAVIHGEVNWQKGIPFSANLYHMQAHLERFKEGQSAERIIEPKNGETPFTYTDGDVENLAAIMWGCAAMIHYIRTNRAELDDRPYKLQKSASVGIRPGQMIVGPQGDPKSRWNGGS